MQDSEEIDVLLIGESARSFSHIVERLEKSGCRCRFVNSYEEARRLLLAEACELVLSVIPPRENAISSLAGLLVGRRASVYYAQPVEDGCWWLPALRFGERCFGAPALRPSEFAIVLGQMVEEIRTGRESKPEPVVRMMVLPEETRAREPVNVAVKARSKAAS
jgi:hypothetical protein